jgi:multisubunit Na+/H+ antiporter MnhG subunit
MPEGLNISNRTRNTIIIVLALFLLFVCVSTFYNSRIWINRPFAGFVVLKNNLVPTVALPGWEGLNRGVKFGDVVVSADGKPVASGDELNEYVASKPPGSLVSYTINRRGRQLSLDVPVSVFTLKDNIFLFVFLVFLGSIFYSMGLVVFYLKPDTPAARAFLVNGVLVGATMAALPGYVTTHTNNFIILFSLPLIGPSFTLLGLYFPEVHKARNYYIALAFGIALPVAVLYNISFLNIKFFMVMDTIMIVLLSVTNPLGVWLMARSFYRSEDPMTRQKAKIAVYGLTMTAMISVVFVIGTLVFKQLSFFLFLPELLPVSSRVPADVSAGHRLRDFKGQPF